MFMQQLQASASSSVLKSARFSINRLKTARTLYEGSSVRRKVYSYDTETKQQSLQWTTCSIQAEKGTYIQVVSFDFCRVVHHEFVLQSETVNTEYDRNVLRCLRQNNQCK